jgi:hypothetical protein
VTEDSEANVRIETLGRPIQVASLVTEEHFSEIAMVTGSSRTRLSLHRRYDVIAVEP